MPAPVDIAFMITGATYPAVVPVTSDTSTLTQAELTNTAFALGERTEFLRNFVPAASGHPERFFWVREDFPSGKVDTGDSRIYSDHTWVTSVTGAASASVGGGDAKHPGLLVQTIISPSTSHAYFLGAFNANPLRFDQLLTATFVMAVNESGVNVATSFSVGLKEDASVQNGGTDCLQIQYAPSSANWQIISRRAGVQTTTNSGVPVVFLEYIVVRIDRDVATNNLSVFINGALILIILAAAAPTGNCTFGGLGLSSVADTFILSTFTDFIEVVSNTGASRAGL
jgi:hypothetical protein